MTEVEAQKSLLDEDLQSNGALFEEDVDQDEQKSELAPHPQGEHADPAAEQSPDNVNAGTEDSQPQATSGAEPVEESSDQVQAEPVDIKTKPTAEKPPPKTAAPSKTNGAGVGSSVRKVSLLPSVPSSYTGD